MNYAIGLIETKGLVASIEALDAALKAANVKLVNKELAEGGLVMITFEGDVGAVSAAVDAGAMAASRVGEVVSAHIIPRLSQEVWGIVRESEKEPIEQAECPKVPQSEMTENTSSEEQAQAIGQAQATEEPQSMESEDEKIAEKADIKQGTAKGSDAKASPDLTVTFKNRTYSVFEKGGIDRLKVVQLRQVARQLNLRTIDRGMIKFANKEELMTAIRKHFRGGDSK